MNQSVEMNSFESDETRGSADDFRKPELFAVVIALVLLLETVLILGWVLRKADHGFDLSDESFYMIWIERPLEYPVSAYQFGSVLSLPFGFLSSDLVVFRQFNILTTYGLAFIVAYQLLGAWLQRLACTILVRLAVAAAFALPSLTVMTYWLMTPSYNSLNGVAFLLVCVAVFSNPQTDRRQMITALLIGLGGYLSFMAKPTSAAVLGVMVLVFVWGIERWCWKSLVVAVCTAFSLLLISMCWVAGDPISFVLELRETLSLDTHPDYSFFRLIRWNSPHLDTRWRMTFGVASVLLVVLLRVVNRKGAGEFCVLPVRGLSCVLLGLGAFGVVAAWFDFQTFSVGFLEYRDDEYGRKERYLFLSLLSVAVFAAYFREMDRRRLAAACFLFWLPYAFAFGTNINCWDKGATIAFFWVISLVVAISALPPRKSHLSYVILIASFLPLFCVLDLEYAYNNPYRQESFTESTRKPVAIGRGKTEVMMAEDTADLVELLRQETKAAGFEEGMPVLDLTAQGVGLIYMIGGYKFPNVWSKAGTPWAEKRLRQLLVQRRDEGLENLWILKKEGWAESNPDTVLEEVGLSMADFVEAVRIPTTAVVGNPAPRLLRADQTDVHLVLYKRKRSDEASRGRPESTP
ncbi:hypothetical protein OAF83_02750 [Rubripirellula sp.]|nr:hypothetical protein [Rubripirellula sp.]MDB4749805.1 hypothetical protein [Rubripirellula sp.]